MLRWRLLLGTAFIAALAGLCWLDLHAAMPGIWLMPLVLVLSLVGTQELLGLLKARGLRPIAWPLYVGNLAVVASNWAAVLHANSTLGPLGWPLLVLALAVLLAIMAQMRRYTGPGAVMEQLGLSMFCLVYVGLLLSFVCQLRLIGGGRTGLAAVVSLLIVVKLCDVGAYTFGRLFGRHKMSPILSPGKTWEGAAGGLALACLGAWLALHVLAPRISVQALPAGPWYGWAAFGLVVGMAGILGDLAESLIKRDVGRKDSSTWMPGFGGVLDLLDSILFAAPVAYLLWALKLVP
ncbi:MAG: phosphatidate cytidylyltransferase [Pirellulales bacterium]